MRLNRFIAQATGLSRRAADTAIQNGRVQVDSRAGQLGEDVSPTNRITLDGQTLKLPEQTLTMMLNKPVGYVCSRTGQGAKTIYDLLPPEYRHLKPVGRLDKDSSGLLLLTNDGQLANQLTHPSFQKQKVYKVRLDKPLTSSDLAMLERGVPLDDGPSHLRIKFLSPNAYQVTMTEGRNRQIRRTFAALGYSVTRLHRTTFAQYTLDTLPKGEVRLLASQEPGPARRPAIRRPDL